jgi:CubicO group peptidase (beta-lactamase class C family)
LAHFQDALDRLNATIEPKIQALNDPGLALGLTDRGRLLFVGTYGLANRDAQTPVTQQSLFQIGSISKAFSSIVLLQLQEQGLLLLDDPVTRHLPWFEVQSEYAPITLRHLMSHTAGIVMGTDETPAAFTEVWNLRKTRATVSPGEMFHYSNSGYKILGLVLQTILGQPMAEILRQQVLTPLGMTASEPVITNATRSRLAVGYEPFYDDRPLARGGLLAPSTWFESETADGAICSNVEDMCRYTRALLNRGAGLVTPESFEELISPVISTGDGLHGEYYGLGLFTQQLGGHHVIGHSGGMVGYQAHLLADLDSGLGVVCLSNTPNDPKRIAVLAWEMLVPALAGDEVPEIPANDPEAVQNGADYAGRYQGSDKVFSLIPKGERRYLEFEGDTVLLEPAGADVFLVPHPAFELYLLRFERESHQEGEEKAQVSEALHGPDVYIREGFRRAPIPSYPPEWEAYPGHYRSHNPWLTNFRVILRKGKLVLSEPQGDEEPLTPIEAGVFRVGPDPRSPEFIRFELIINGKAMRVNLSGGAYSRMFTP